ncbi:serine hydrolase domain-containing protein [Spirosoma migulaei]
MIRSLLLIHLVLIGILPAWGQALALATNHSPVSSVHQAHQGQLTFAASDIRLEHYQASDFLTAYTLTPKSELFITAFLAKPLSDYLAKLAPQQSATERIGLGSYQFSFYVDRKLVYTGNLPPDHIEAVAKQTQTVLRQPFIAYPRQRKWGESIWNLFLRNGGQQALTEGKHTLTLEMRPFLSNPTLKVGPIIAQGQLVLDVQLDPVIDPATVQLSQLTPYAGIAISSDKIDVDRFKTLKGKINASVFKDITSVVVLKNGKLLMEEYFNGANRQTLHDVRSVGKSFASTVAGIAIGEDYLMSEQQGLKDFYRLNDFAHYSPQKDNTTLKELLTMSSVFEGDDDRRASAGNEENMYPTANWVKFALDLPVDSVRKAGEWHYFTAGVVVLGDILDKQVPGGLERYADQKLFGPLGITAYKWQYTPQKVANTAGGIRMNALDFAKYGQLYKNGGAWQGQQLIPKVWIDKTFTRHKAIPGRPGEYYGYLFWNRTYHVNDKLLETYYCAGNGGNKIYIFKDQPLVVVVTATAFGTSYAHTQVDKMMEEYILPATLGSR